MWVDDISLLRKKFQEMARDIEPLNKISAEKRRGFIFDNLFSSDDDRFFVGCWFVVYWEESLTEKDKEEIKDAILSKRKLFRKFQDNELGYYYTNAYLFLLLCLILDIEPTDEEVDLGMTELLATPEDLEVARESLNRVIYSQKNQS